MIYTYQHGGETFTVRLERLPDGGYQAAVGEHEYRVEASALPNGGWLLNLDGERVIAYVAADGAERHIWVNGQTYTLTPPEMRATRRRGAAAGGGDLTAQMPGQVIEVLVRDGDAVTRGQALVTLEAMKMELRVTAPGDGRVRRVLVKAGDVVERGQRLVEME